MTHAFDFSAGRDVSIQLAEDMFEEVDKILKQMLDEDFYELLDKCPWDYLRMVMEDCEARIETNFLLNFVECPLPSNGSFKKYAELIQSGDVVINAASDLDKKIQEIAKTNLCGYYKCGDKRQNLLKGREDSKFQPIIQSELTNALVKCLNGLNDAYTRQRSKVQAASQQNGFVTPMIGVADSLFGFLIDYVDLWRSTCVPKYVQKMQELSDAAEKQVQAAAQGAAAAAQNAGAVR